MDILFLYDSRAEIDRIYHNGKIVSVATVSHCKLFEVL